MAAGPSLSSRDLEQELSARSLQRRAEALLATPSPPERAELATTPTDFATLGLAIRLPNLDPLAAIAEADFAWSDPEDELSFVAIGRTLAWRGAGPDRFRDAGSWLSTLIAARRAEGRDDSHEGWPLVTASFAFSDQELHGLWSGWPCASLALPRILIARRRAEARLFLNLRLSELPGTDWQQLSSELCAIGLALQKSPLCSKTNSHLGEPEPLEDEASWTRRIRSAQAAMSAGALEKVVLARALAWRSSPDQPFDPRASFLAATELEPSAIQLAIFHPDGSAFIAATPERLLRVRQGAFETHALAGTIARAASPEEDSARVAELLSSAKDRIEQGLVTRDIEARLAGFISELRADPEPQVRSLPLMHHLETRLRGHLRKIAIPGRNAITELAAALHPTPALGGSPREAARDWIQRTEPLERGLYAAPQGWISADQDSVLAVAIRSVLIRPEQATGFGGAGIVAASNPASEWRETALKLRVARRFLRKSPARIDSERDLP